MLPAWSTSRSSSGIPTPPGTGCWNPFGPSPGPGWRRPGRPTLPPPGTWPGAPAWPDSLKTHSRGPRPDEAYDLFDRELGQLPGGAGVGCLTQFARRDPPAGAVQAGGAVQVAPRSTWELVVFADRDYYEQVQAEGIDFPMAAYERHFRLEGDRATIGRRSPSRGIYPDIDLSAAPTDTGISHQHAILVRQDGAWAIIDPGATNGVFLNDGDEPLPRNQPVPLREEDRLHIGAWTTLTLQRVD